MVLHHVAGILALGLVASCGGEPEPADTVLQTDTPAPRAASAPGSLGRVTSAGALATRHEAQASFDRARDALVAKDLALASRELADAAAFMRKHAEEGEPGAKASLQGASKELETLSRRLEQGEAQTIRTFDRVVANANRAEGQHHLMRAEAAMAKREYPLAGEEMTMAVDHLERAAHDLGGGDHPAAEVAVANARAFAERLMRGAAPTRDEARTVRGQLEDELRRLCAVIDAEAVACALEPAR
jgi:hypothetical protein